MRTVIRVMICLALVISALLPAFVARAALPTNQTWVKYSGNPVVPSGTCGVATPARPAVFVESTNNYKMYFSNLGDGSQLYLATTSDGGLTWTCGNSGNPVLTLGAAGSWDEKRVVSSSVIKDGATYKMWYSGRSAAGGWAIGYATSPDGISWTKYASNPVLTVGSLTAWDSQMVREPSVLLIGATYHLWYAGTSKWPYFKIGHATSADGITWIKDSAPVLIGTSGSWDQNETYGPSVVQNGGDLEMFYSGNNGDRWLTGHATSTDGINWTKDANPFLSPSSTGWDSADSTDYVGAVLDSGKWKIFYSGAGAGGYQIGLMTLESQAQLTFNLLATSVAVGSDVVLTIDLNAVTDLYGYQFEVNYDAARLSVAESKFVDSFFDTGGNASIVPSWNASCSAGVCRFAVTKVQPGAPVSGSGALAQIKFTGVAPGVAMLTISNDILSDRDANQIQHSATTGYLTVYGWATVSGVVKLQGRSTPIDSGTVTLYDQNGLFGPTAVSFDAVTGAWSASVPVFGSTTYDIVASHTLYLSNRLDGVSVTAGGSFAQTTTTLRGGDANNDGQIELGDLTCVGGAFGGPPSACGSTGSTDINHDGIVNILDLVLPGGNYGLTSPQTW